MRAGASTVERPQRKHRLGLAALILGLALGAVALYLAAGPPKLPDSLPDWTTIQLTLHGDELPLAAAAYVLTTAAWLLWGWIILSLVLRLLVGIADARTGGAVWVGVLRALSDRTTLPVVRRLVDGALVAVMVVNLAGASMSVAAAAPLPPPTAMTISITQTAESSPDAASSETHPQATHYTVQPGDTLWTIAERFYGTGFAYPRLVDANAGREMSDGGRFTRAGVIQPGWTLEIPSPTDEVIAGQDAYVVQPGDTLRNIAARMLGDEVRWQELFDLNQGTARLDDGRALTDPNLIRPGLSLTLPRNQVAATSSPAEPVAPPAASSANWPSSAPSMKGLDVSPTVIAPEPPAPSAMPIPSVSPAETPTPSVFEFAVAMASDLPLPLTYVATLAAAITALGGAMLLVRRRLRRALSEPLRSSTDAADPTMHDGFVELSPTRRPDQAMQMEAEAVLWVVEQVTGFLRAAGLADITVVTVCQGRGSLTLMLRAERIDLDRLSELASEIGSRLGGSGQASVSPDQDLLLQLSHLKPKRFPLSLVHRAGDDCCLVPLGMLPNRELLYANWMELGPVLIAGMSSAGPAAILTSLITTLCARYRPDELKLWTLASSTSLPEALADLPHRVHGFTEPVGRDDVGSILGEFREELTRRMRPIVPEDAGTAGPQQRPMQLLVVGELTDLVDEATALDIIGAHGPAHGMYLLAAVTRIDELDEELLISFSTRLVLQTLSEEQSIRLLGRPDAADLGEGGDAWLRIDGRVPVRMRGFRIAGEDLHRLVRVMQSEFGQ
ncbi:LysM peptidoglycan-binding domain-containing protein, partial [Nitrolancea hollandica]|uniref:LysM peptidoglycan-binding domain-containing protein n=1 Tax=Nitrolancea hollandica TaxID=1206749 RepID=UPI00058ACDB0